MYLHLHFYTGKTFPLSLLSTLWNECVSEVYEQLLEAYASVQICDMQGRNQMLLDTNDLFTGIENISPVLSNGKASKDKVEAYIKAFYITRREDMNDWIKRNARDYEPHHVERLQNM